MAYEFCDPLFLGSIWEAIVIPLHRCVCIWTTFWCVCCCRLCVAFGSIRLSVWVGTYLGQLWMTLDNNNNNNIHSVVVVWGCSIGSRYVNVRRDLPRLLFFVHFFLLPNVRIQVVGFLENAFSFSFPYKLRSISGAFFFPLWT